MIIVETIAGMRKTRVSCIVNVLVHSCNLFVRCYCFQSFEENIPGLEKGEGVPVRGHALVIATGDAPGLVIATGDVRDPSKGVVRDRERLASRAQGPLTDMVVIQGPSGEGPGHILVADVGAVLGPKKNAGVRLGPGAGIVPNQLRNAGVGQGLEVEISIVQDRTRSVSLDQQISMDKQQEGMDAVQDLPKGAGAVPSLLMDTGVVLLRQKSMAMVPTRLQSIRMHLTHLCGIEVSQAHLPDVEVSPVRLLDSQEILVHLRGIGVLPSHMIGIIVVGAGPDHLRGTEVNHPRKKWTMSPGWLTMKEDV